MVSLRLFLLVFAFTVFFVLITYIVNRFIKGNKFIKYSPVVLGIAASIYNFYLSGKASQGFEDIARALMGILFLVGALSSLFAGLFIDFALPQIKKLK